MILTHPSETRFNK